MKDDVILPPETKYISIKCFTIHEQFQLHTCTTILYPSHSKYQLKTVSNTINMLAKMVFATILFFLALCKTRCGTL